MNKIETFVCSIFFSAVSLISYGQAYDSLVKVLPSLHSDTHKVNVLMNVTRTAIGLNINEARRFAGQGLSLSKKLGYKKGEADLYFYIGYINTLSKENDSTTFFFHRAAQLNKQLGDQYWEANAYWQLASYYKSNRLADSAITYFEKAERIMREIGKLKESAHLLRSLGNTYYFNKSNYREAIDYLERSHDTYDKLDLTENMTNVNNDLANVYHTLGKYEIALQFYLNSLRNYEQSNDQYGLGISYINLGNFFFTQGAYDKCIEYGEMAVNVFKVLKDSSNLAMAYNNIGAAYQKMGKLDDAAVNNLRALEIRLAIDEEEWLSQSYNNLAVIQEDLGDTSRALYYFNLALQVSEKLKKSSMPENIRVNLARIYISMGQYDNALEFLEVALDKSRTIDDKVIQQEVFKQLSVVYAAQRKYPKALEYFKAYEALKDSILRIENKKSLQLVEAKFDIEQKDYEIQQLQNEQKINNLKLKDEANQTRMAYGILGFSVILLSLFVYAFVQKRRDNIVIKSQKRTLQVKNEEIASSITYAHHIQTAILPMKEKFMEHVQGAFLFYRPKDIVSGDYYWFKEVDGVIYIAVVDCTGHGVPGALMSMIGVSIMEQIVNETDNISCAGFLETIDASVKKALKQGSLKSGPSDGMDLVLCKLDRKTGNLQYAGANRPLIYLRGGELHEIKPDKMGIGGGLYKGEEKKFSEHTIPIKDCEMIYLFSDGFADQFGGPQGKKFLIKRLKLLLHVNGHLPPKDQLASISRAFDDWRGDEEQVDDVCLMGVKP